MKSNFSVLFGSKSLFLGCLFLLAGFGRSVGQQNVGAHPNIDAGFESQATGNLPSQTSSLPNTSTTYWAYSISGNGQTRTINATGGYGGPKYLSVGKTAPTSNTSTTAVSNLVTTNTFQASTKYIVQFHYKISLGAIDTAGSYVFLSGDNTSGSRALGNLTGLSQATTWTKFSRIITTGAAQTTLGTVGVIAKMVGAADGTNSGVIDVDNVVAYPADNQTTPAADVTAPGVVTGLTALGNPAVVKLTWSAPAGGVDGGGYMVVRFTADPTGEPNPLQNAVYKANAANTIGATGEVVYVGTDNFFDDATAVIGSSYWYRVYTVDKAFNYSNPVAAGPAIPTPKVNYYYFGTASTALLTSWWTNPNGTGSHPPNFTNAGQVYHLRSNADLVSSLAITGAGSSLILGSSAGVNAFTVQFNSGTFPFIDTIYQSADGYPMVLNFNNPNVPSINALYDIFTQVHYRASGIPIAVGTTKEYDSVFVENNADVTFNGGSSTVPPIKTNGFFVAAGSNATVGTLSTRWIQIKPFGKAVINGKITTPKLAGLVSNGSAGAPSSAGGAIQFEDAGADLVLGPNSTVEYSSTSTTNTQTITPRTDYKNVTISGTGRSKTVSAPIAISGTLTMNAATDSGLILRGGALTLNSPLVLTRGRIYTDATNILILGANASVTGGNSTSYVAGPMKRNTAATSSYVFPTGKGGRYRPCAIKPAATSAAVFQAEFFSTPYSSLAVTAPLTSVDTTYWNISRASGTTAATVALSLDSSVLPNAVATDTIMVAQYNTTAWSSVNATPILPGTAISGTAVSSSLSTFGFFTFGLRPNASVVPLSLISFSGMMQNGKAALRWTTENESNLSHFVVESGKDGRYFSAQGTVYAFNGTVTNNYSFTGALVSGNNYFRLKMVDRDGKYSYSNILLLKNNLSPVIKPTVNPIQNHIVSLRFENLQSGNYQIGFYNSAGQLVQVTGVHHEGITSTYDVPLGGALSSGMYRLKVTGQKEQMNATIIIT
jgi:hypothetical protein